MMIEQELRTEIEGAVTKEAGPYRITNLRGFVMRIGQRAKQRVKQARAPILQAPNMSSRSQRLTRIEIVYLGSAYS